MAITLSGSGGLFTRLGRLAKCLYDAHTYSGGAVLTDFNAAIAALGTEYALLAPLPPALLSVQASADNVGSVLRSVAQAVLLKQVNDDAPQANKTSIPLAMAELIRQMGVAAASVPACTVAVTPAAISGTLGTGVVLAGTRNGAGLVQQNTFAEIGQLTCTADAQSGGVAVGSERWSYRGDYATSNVLSHLWPGFSGATASLTTIDSQAAGLLRNGGMETFTVTNVPDNWAYLVGTVTTHFLRESSTIHRGTYALKWIGDGSTLHSMANTFAANVLKPNRVYAVEFRARASTGLTGLLSVSLVDGSNATVTDDQAANNLFTFGKASVSTSAWTSISGVFITPRVLPSSLKLLIKNLTTAIPSGQAIYIDSVAVAEMTFLYPGGPALAVFAGAASWIVNDRYSITTTNNRNGATYGATWQTVFERFFGMRAMGLMLPASGSPTLADTLITS